MKYNTKIHAAILLSAILIVGAIVAIEWRYTARPGCWNAELGEWRQCR